MFQFITIGIVALVGAFGIVSAHANTLIDGCEEEKYIAAIRKTYPVSDERHKFASAMVKVVPIMNASKEGDIFSISQTFPIIEPFLNSHNNEIKRSAEDVMRLIKSGLNIAILTLPPEDASSEEVKRAVEKGIKESAKFLVSYSDFLRSCIPEQPK